MANKNAAATYFTFCWLGFHYPFRPVFVSVHLVCHKTAHYFKNTYLTLLRASLVSCTVQGLNECSFNTKQINKKRNIKHSMLTFIVECMHILTTCFAFINDNSYSAFFSRKLSYYVDLYLFRNVLCRDLHYCISLHISAPSSPTQIAKTLVAE